MTRYTNMARDDKGFTLVELAVVLVIIGLLLGGVLRGQEMIANARVTSTIAQAKATQAAFNSFIDIYDSVPGDMANAGARLANCTGTCVAAGAGVGDNQISVVPFAAAAGAESTAFFPQLQAAELISGLDGDDFLQGEIDGTQFQVGFHNGTVALGSAGTNVARRGHYSGLSATTNPLNGLSGTQAARIDRKMDDGISNTGSVISTNTTGCQTAGVYTESSAGANCAVAIRIDG